MEKKIQEILERIEYLQADLNNLHDEKSLIFIRGQISGLKESLVILKGEN